MKIAIFYPRNLLASYYTLGGYRETLERMGHSVLECAFPGNVVQDVEQVRKRMPTIEQLNQQDVILSTFHEYVHPWLVALYGFEAWSRLQVPVIARFDESMDRMDLNLPARVPELKRWAQHYSFPAEQDAKKYGGQWLPFGADTSIFRPILYPDHGEVTAPSLTEKNRYCYCHRPKDHTGECSNTPDRNARLWGEEIRYPGDKKYDLGFIGTLYPDRRKYLDSLVPHIGVDVTFRCGNVFIQDLGGIRGRESTELLAENYRQISIFFVLPSASRLIVAKTVDILACGTFVMYPRLFGDAVKNLSQFEDKKEIVYYELGYVADNGKQIRHYLECPKEREVIAAAGCAKVHRDFTLTKMLEKLLAPVTDAKTEKLPQGQDVSSAQPR